MLNVSLLLKVLTTPPYLWLQQLPLIISVLSEIASETHSLKLLFALTNAFVTMLHFYEFLFGFQ